MKNGNGKPPSLPERVAQLERELEETKWCLARAAGQAAAATSRLDDYDTWELALAAALVIMLGVVVYIRLSEARG